MPTPERTPSVEEIAEEIVRSLVLQTNDPRNFTHAKEVISAALQSERDRAERRVLEVRNGQRELLLEQAKVLEAKRESHVAAVMKAIDSIKSKPTDSPKSIIREGAIADACIAAQSADAEWRKANSPLP